MRHYETIVILDPDLAEEERTPLLDRFEEILTKNIDSDVPLGHEKTRL